MVDKMTKFERDYFAAGVKTANAAELLAAWELVTLLKPDFDKSDYKFMVSHLGRRSERLLRNVVENGSFEDKKKTERGEAF